MFLPAVNYGVSASQIFMNNSIDLDGFLTRLDYDFQREVELTDGVDDRKELKLAVTNKWIERGDIDLEDLK